MDSPFPPEPAECGFTGDATLVSSVMALLDIARLEIDQDRAIAKASIVRVCELLRAAGTKVQLTISHAVVHRPANGTRE